MATQRKEPVFCVLLLSCLIISFSSLAFLVLSVFFLASAFFSFFLSHTLTASFSFCLSIHFFSAGVHFCSSSSVLSTSSYYHHLIPCVIGFSSFLPFRFSFSLSFCLSLFLPCLSVLLLSLNVLSLFFLRAYLLLPSTLAEAV